MTQLADCRRLAVLLPAALCLCFADSLPAQPGAAALVVHVYNSANASPTMLTETGSYVQEALARIRVEVIWVDETSRLHGADAPPVQSAWSDHSTAHVSLAIVSNAEQVAPHLKNEETAMGWTPAGQSERAYVFYDRVQAFVLKNAFRVSGLRVPRIVAYAVEHELGHLLIPPLTNAHSDTGIMKGRLGPDDIAPIFLDRLSFSVKEGDLMRQEIRRRISMSLH
jgi:hypothetical protein